MEKKIFKFNREWKPKGQPDNEPRWNCMWYTDIRYFTLMRDSKHLRLILITCIYFHSEKGGDRRLSWFLRWWLLEGIPVKYRIIIDIYSCIHVWICGMGSSLAIEGPIITRLEHSIIDILVVETFRLYVQNDIIQQLSLRTFLIAGKMIDQGL